MADKPTSSPTDPSGSIRLAQVWKEIPLIAKVMLFGLVFTSGLVVSSFVELVLQPGPLVPGEDLYIHIALVFLVPGALVGLAAVSFGYAYYMICKRLKRQPFWKIFMKESDV